MNPKEAFDFLYRYFEGFHESNLADDYDQAMSESEGLTIEGVHEALLAAWSVVGDTCEKAQHEKA